MADLSAYPEVMGDIETLSTETHAVVLSIGAVRFALDGNDTWETLTDDRCVYTVIDQHAQLEIERHVSASTKAWWAQQSPEARTVLTATPVSVPEGLKAFSALCAGASNLWGNGNMFDNAILRSLYKDFDTAYPIPYWGDLDLRTLKLIAGIDKPSVPKGVAHNALDDAKYQVLCAQEYWRTIHGKKA